MQTTSINGLSNAEFIKQKIVLNLQKIVKTYPTLYFRGNNQQM